MKWVTVAWLMMATPADAAGRLFLQPFLLADPPRLTGESCSADVNGDGHLDLVMVSGGTATVLHGDGSGSLAAVRTFPFSSTATLGNVGADDLPDLVSPEAVKLNNGNETFGAELPVGDGGITIRLSDLNADGALDMVVVGSDLRVRLGNGHGTFTASYPFALPSAARSLTLADVNGDGRQDALVPCEGTQGKISLFLGTGNATLFQPRNDDLSGNQPNSVAVGDLNHDGWTDLAVVCLADASVGFIYLGNGDGTFKTPTTVSMIGGAK
jgi:hypothetical protein